MRGRLRQVLYFLFVRPTPEDLRRAALRLTPELFALFRSMKSQDQAHGARVADRLFAMGAPEHVVAAGYLHDVGKPHDFGLFWRSVMVLFPGDPPPARPQLSAGGSRARQIYHHHSRYAAEALSTAGGSAALAAIVMGTPGSPWLAEFQLADDAG